ncbi:MAG: peptide deformylase [Leptolyngbyaceae cyanobacterium SL_5_14]|nr:peptide deformylase [Leptolyngbyaceae cyanobacterium SL_5_14]
MAVRDLLLLGNPQLYQISEAVNEQEIELLGPVITDLHDTLMAFRKKWKAGRAIAAPQIGVMKRVIYLNIDCPVVLINPFFAERSETMLEVWDDCMCFPDLLVKVRRYESCRIVYRDMNWQQQSMNLGICKIVCVKGQNKI